ncbi:MAG TPA: DinB family protein [Chitinophagaceae bacterium]|nr:DinB family protein [Chitinophagaceae bacterium]
MALNQALLGELKHESANTRKMLERVPTDKLSWKPHEKSYTLGRLATHIAALPAWIGRTINLDEFDLAKNQIQPVIAGNTEGILKIFDDSLATNIPILESASDDILNTNWTFRRGDHIIFTMPRKVVLRNMAFNHTVHHRAQLSVYLRLLDVPVPGMYGPSADEM